MLTDDDKTLIRRLTSKLRTDERELVRLDRYYDGEQRLQHLGLAVPPELRKFETIVNVPAMAVDEPTGRQELRAFYRAGEEKPDSAMREAWTFNNLDSQSSLVHKDRAIYGRTYVSVTANPDDPEYPLITPESPLSLATIERRGRIVAGFKLYKEEGESQQRGVLYLPDRTMHVIRGRSGWEQAGDIESDTHNLGAVPLVMFLNRPRAGRFVGQSEMSRVISKTDAIARLITNMQVAAETLALPHRWVAGIDPAEFVDDKGEPLPVWEAYMTAIRATANKDAKFGQWEAASLSNFNDSVNEMLCWCAAELGLPVRFMGQQTVNPAAEGAIIADMERLVTNVDRMNRFDGDSWAWVMGLYEWIRTGTEPGWNSIRATWFDPNTPTYSQRAEAIFKQTTGDYPILSREGAWEELGWSAERMERERGRFREQQLDPLTQAVIGGTDIGA